ncbi:MAG: tRNA (N6-threonylcarbamoyladenosine(37)-N6)-methyltransferase TrmO [Verrucomicrobiota bacterium]
MASGPEVPSDLQQLTVRPIGFIRAPKQVKFQTLHQPDEAVEEHNVVELLPGSGFDRAVADLSGFTRIWLLSWFHRNTSWRPMVMPPRGPSRRRGLFATRSPHRPNPIGLTPVRLFGVERLRLRIGPCDLMDGTPILDIKPYIPAYDAFPGESGGWTDDIAVAHQEPPRFQVGFTALAITQAEWLREHWAVDFRPRLIELLGRDPSVQRTRRIRARGPDRRVVGCGAWRAVFRVEGFSVEVLSLEPGYPPRFLEDLRRLDVPDREAQQAFLKLWPEQTISGG